MFNAASPILGIVVAPLRERIGRINAELRRAGEFRHELLPLEVEPDGFELVRCICSGDSGRLAAMIEHIYMRVFDVEPLRAGLAASLAERRDSLTSALEETEQAIRAAEL